jgi:hypothetical protein
LRQQRVPAGCYPSATARESVFPEDAVTARGFLWCPVCLSSLPHSVIRCLLNHATAVVVDGVWWRGRQPVRP